MQADAINIRLLQLSGQYYHKQITEEEYRAQRQELFRCALALEGREPEQIAPVQAVPEVVTPAVVEHRPHRAIPPWVMLTGLILLMLTVAAVVVLAAL